MLLGIFEIEKILKNIHLVTLSRINITSFFSVMASYLNYSKVFDISFTIRSLL